MFENLKARFVENQEERKVQNAFYIAHGFCENWNDENKKESDDGIRRYSTDTRWNQYQAGKIDREKAVALAVARNNKKIEKETAEKLSMLERVAAAPDLNYINVSVNFVRNTYWGYNPHVEVWSDSGRTYGTASGCGYDKESAAVASALNASDSVLKVLFGIKESGLASGLSDRSSTCTGVSNREICGYGAGYSVIPCFEGGVGVGCFWSILEKAGFKVNANYGKRENFYNVYKAV